jgi:sirohydrochlorin ferrochelatase
MPDPVGYSGKPLIQKLGLKEAGTLKPVGAPEGYADWIALLPAGAVVDADAAVADLVHLFVGDRAGLERGAAPALAAVRPGGMLWVSWPKKASPLFRDLTEDGLREVLLPTGWVDVKVCAVSADWSGLKFLRRKA